MEALVYEDSPLADYLEGRPTQKAPFLSPHPTES
jgi:hypothetical protein